MQTPLPNTAIVYVLYCFNTLTKIIFYFAFSQAFPPGLGNHKHSRQRGQTTPGSGADFLPFVLAGSVLCSGFSNAGGSPRTGARRISLTTQEAGWVWSAGTKCLHELSPCFTANGSPTQLTTPLLQGWLCISSFGKASERTASPTLGLTPFEKLEAIPGTSRQPNAYRP